eukprot:6547301-Ditylum_brightwellii.AAC.1
MTRLEAEQCSTLSPELQPMIENTKKIFARHKTYLLQKAEEEATATFPLLLEELLNTIPTVPPTAGAYPLLSPSIRAKHAYASAHLPGKAGIGPGPLLLTMSFNCAPFPSAPHAVATPA